MLQFSQLKLENSNPHDCFYVIDIYDSTQRGRLLFSDWNRPNYSVTKRFFVFPMRTSWYLNLRSIYFKETFYSSSSVQWLLLFFIEAPFKS